MTEYWIVFKHSTHWTQRFLKAGFGHCYVLTKDKYNWYTIDPRTCRLELQILGYAVNDDVPRIFKSQGCNVVKVMAYDVRKSRLHFKSLAFINCVGIVKYVLGVKLLAFTPYQLYKKLTTKIGFNNIWVSKIIL